MRKHQDCEAYGCQKCHGPDCLTCDAMGCDCYLLEAEAERNMSPQERAGWIRAMDEGVD